MKVRALKLLHGPMSLQPLASGVTCNWLVKHALKMSLPGLFYDLLTPLLALLSCALLNGFYDYEYIIDGLGHSNSGRGFHMEFYSSRPLF